MITIPVTKDDVLISFRELITFIIKCGDVFKPHELKLEELKVMMEDTDDYFNKLIEIYNIYLPRMGSYGEGLVPNRINEVSQEYKKYSSESLRIMFDEKLKEFRDGILNLLFSKGFTEQEINKRDEERVKVLREKFFKKKK